MPGLSSLAHKIAAVPSLARVDLETFYRFKPQRRLFKKGTVLISTGMVQTSAYLICSGWAISCRTLPSGERQLVNFLLPGDFAGIDAGLAPLADRTVEAQTAVTAFVLDANCLGEFLKSDGQLGDAAIWSMMQETSIITERLCSLGRRSALERVCHFLLELWIRLRQIEMSQGESFFIPLTLGDMADAVGMSEVHLSRTVHRIREAKLFEIDFAHRKVTVLNAAEAARISSFDPAYLKCHTKAARSLIEHHSNTAVPPN